MEKNDGYQHWDMHFREQLLRESMETKKKLILISLIKKLKKRRNWWVMACGASLYFLVKGAILRFALSKTELF